MTALRTSDRRTRAMAGASAAMTLDVYADLFDDDLDHVAKVLNDARLASSVGRMWADAPTNRAQT